MELTPSFEVNVVIWYYPAAPELSPKLNEIECYDSRNTPNIWSTGPQLLLSVS